MTHRVIGLPLRGNRFLTIAPAHLALHGITEGFQEEFYGEVEEVSSIGTRRFE
jgi:hypothetical protein